MSVSSDLGVGTFRTGHTVGPSNVADCLKAFRIIDQVVDLYQWSIGAVYSLRELSSQVRNAHDNYAKMTENLQYLCTLEPDGLRKQGIRRSRSSMGPFLTP